MAGGGGGSWLIPTHDLAAQEQLRHTQHDPAKMLRNRPHTLTLMASAFCERPGCTPPQHRPLKAATADVTTPTERSTSVAADTLRLHDPVFGRKPGQIPARQVSAPAQRPNRPQKQGRHGQKSHPKGCSDGRTRPEHPFSTARHVATLSRQTAPQKQPERQARPPKRPCRNRAGSDQAETSAATGTAPARREPAAPLGEMQHGWGHAQGLTLGDLTEAATQRILGASGCESQAYLASHPACYQQLASVAREVAPARQDQYTAGALLGTGDAAMVGASHGLAETLPSVVVPSHHHLHHQHNPCVHPNAAADAYGLSPVDELQRQQQLLREQHRHIYAQATTVLRHTCQAFNGEPILAAHSHALEADMAASHAAASEFLAQQVAHGTVKLREQLVPFRKKRDHPKQAKKILEAWYQTNADNLGRAYCSKEDRARLAEECDLQPKQVSTWVSNRRNRQSKEEEEEEERRAEGEENGREGSEEQGWE